MFTKDSRILNHRLTVPLTSVSKAVGDVFKPTFNQFIKSIFANGEKGFFYDPNDLSTMFQDSAGNVPVTGAGQPVGLMLDKSKGALLSSNLHNDSAVVFTGGSSRISAGVYRVYSESGDLSQITQSLSPELLGRYVEVTVNIESISGKLSTDFGGSPTWSTPGVKKFFGRVFGVGIVFKRAPVHAVDAVIRDISVREVYGNHAYQTTSAARPILRQNAITGAYYLEFDGSDDFLQTANIDFTATDKMSLFAGVRKLSDVVNLELVGFNSAGNGSFYIVTGRGNGSAVAFFSRGTAGAELFVNQGLSPVSSVLTAKAKISAQLQYMKLNSVSGQISVSQGTGNYGNYPLYIGRRGGISLPFNGHIYSLIGIGKLVSDDETLAVEKELAKRLGVTLNV